MEVAVYRRVGRDVTLCAIQFIKLEVTGGANSNSATHVVDNHLVFTLLSSGIPRRAREEVAAADGAARLCRIGGAVDGVPGAVDDRADASTPSTHA